ncbi:MAG: fibronectin type III domain-containing protein, partial [Thermoplasmata archaeon]
QDLTNCSVGMELGYSSDNIIVSNSEANNIYGFYLDSSHRNTISDNDITSNRIWGIYLEDCNGNTLDDNEVWGNALGIYLNGGGGNNITNSKASNNVQGIYLDNSVWNNITNNNISSNTGYGINLFDSFFNAIISNNVTNNENGIFLSLSSNNSIYHNNIINNANQSSDDTNNTNQWDNGYPSGGNYWSDWSPITDDLHSGAATPQMTGNPDGICDEQYNIDSDSVDYYPLKGPWDPNSAPPTAPVNLAAAAGVTYVNITWDSPGYDGGYPVTNYRIYRSLTPGDEMFYMEVGVINYFNDTNVTGGIEYFYKVSAVNILGEGPQSNEASGVPVSLPGAPTGLDYTFGDSFVNLSWSEPASNGGSAIISYNIYRNGSTDILATVPGGQLWYHDPDVINGITYTYNVSANNSVGEGPRSENILATPMTVPSEPQDLVESVGDEYVALWWVMPDDDGGSTITGYNIYRNGIAGVYDTMGPAQAWWIDYDVVNGVTYTYNITALNSVGEGPPATISATPMTEPSEPRNLWAVSGDGYVHLTWEEPLDFGGSQISLYNIYRNDSLDVYATVSASQLWFNDTNVVNGMTYTYNISANNSAGEGPKSAGRGGTPLAVPSAPRNLQAGAGNEYAHLTWDEPLYDGGSEITGYNIYRNGTQGVFASVPAGQLWYNDTNVINGITYTFGVSAVNIAGEGTRSTIPAKPMTVPSAPRNLQEEVGDGFVNITWDNPLDDGGSPVTEYHIYRNDTQDVYATVSGDQLWYNDQSVIVGVTYRYRVAAVNSEGEGGTSSEAVAKAGSVPLPPSDVAAASGDGYVFLTWSPPISNGSHDITNYTIYRGTVLGSETLIAEVGDILFFNDTTAANDVTYYYRIGAVNAIGEGALSEAVNATPSAPVNLLPTCTISSPSPDTEVSGSIVITGSSSDTDGIVQIVQIKIDDGNWTTVTGTESWSHSLDTSSLSNGQHTIHARAFDGENYSPQTSVTVVVNNPVPKEEEETPWMLVGAIIIIIIVLLLLLLLFARKRKPEEEPERAGGEKPEGEAEALPPPPPWMEMEEAEEPSDEVTEEEEELPEPADEVGEAPEEIPEDELPEPLDEETGGEVDVTEEPEEDLPAPPDEEVGEEGQEPDELPEEELPEPLDDEAGENSGTTDEPDEEIHEPKEGEEAP